MQQLHEESNTNTVRSIQIRLAKDYIKCVQKNKIEAILRLIGRKGVYKEQLQKHIGPSDWLGYLKIKPFHLIY